MGGPSTITAQLLTGSQKRVVFTSPTLAVTQVRAAGSDRLLLAVGNQDPASSAASMNGLWKVNTGGTGLTQLVASAAKQGQFAVFSARTIWANVSRDASRYAFQLSGLGKPPSYSLLVGSMNGGQATTVASRADGGLLLIIGWTSS